MRRSIPLLLLAVGVAAVGCNRKPAAGPKDVGPPKVTVARPVVQSVTEFTNFTGTLAAMKTADVRPRVSGFIQKVLFEEGVEVAADQELFQIDPAPFDATVRQAEANLKSAEAQRELAVASEARMRAVRGSAAVTEEQYEQARAQLLVARANVDGAQAALATAKLNREWTTVKAPFAGRIDRIFVNEGNVVTGGTAQGTILTRIVTVDPIFAYFTVDEQSVLNYMRRMIREGRVASPKGSGVPVEIELRDEIGYPHKGTIDFASSELNPNTGSLQIRGVFPNPGPPRLLRPGFFVRGRVPAATAVNAVLVPDEAIIADQAQRVVYVVGPDNRVAARPVTVGPESNGLRVVEGLSPDERVIIRGLARIQLDMVVEPVPGEIRPAQENGAGGPGRRGAPAVAPPQAWPTGPNGNPEQGAAPGGTPSKGK